MVMAATEPDSHRVYSQDGRSDPNLTMTSENFFSVAGQVAIVTGGSQGIGEGIVNRLAAAGARLVILDINECQARTVAHRVGGVSLACDISSASSVERAIGETHSQVGQIQILVNNAGITGKTAPLWDLQEENLDQVYAVNLKGVFLMCRAVIPEMLAQRFGRIINVASIAGKEGNPNLIPYSSTKAAVICLTKALAKEVAGKGDITVNCISPAVVQTPILEGIPKETVDYMVSRIPMGRTGRIEEIAALVHYLVSREASFTTGQCYDISGGRATY